MKKVLILFYTFSWCFLVKYFGYLVLVFATIFMVTLKYFVHNGQIFTSMFAYKFFVPLFIYYSSIDELRYSNKEPFVHWNMLYESGALQIGDIIECNRSSYETSYNWLFSINNAYTHWGVYLADDTVMHLTTDITSSRIVINTQSSLKEASHDGTCRINNLELVVEKFGWKRGTKDEIISRAQLVLRNNGTKFVQGSAYDPVYSNCEHFATFLVFGEQLSLQADHQSKFLTQVLFEDLAYVLILYWHMYFLYKSNIIQSFVDKHKINIIKFLDEIIKFGKWQKENPMKLNLLIIVIAVGFNFFFLNTFSLLYDLSQSKAYTDVKN